MNATTIIAWLRSYAHDLMEDGDLDQEAARLNDAADEVERMAGQIQFLREERDSLIDLLDKADKAPRFT